jgi:hypothetical protein
MPQAHISLFANISKTQIKETDTHFNIEGVPVTVDDAVMNGIHYSAENNKLGMPSIRDRVVTLSHPTTANGNGVDAYAGESLQKFYSGGHIETVYADNGTWKVNISIDKDILRAQDKKQDSKFYDSLANKQDIGVSTGLYAEIEPTIGKNAKGVDYEGAATKQVYNHLAMLDASEPPAGGQSTFMRFNKESQDKVVINLADYMTDSIPDTVYKVEDVNADDKPEAKDDFNGLLAKLLAILGISKLAGNTENKPQQNEENAMPDDIKKKMKALKDNGSYKEGMTDDEISNAFEKMGNMDDAPKAKEVAQNSDILNAIQALTAKVTGLESKLNAKDDAVKNALVDELKDLDTGLSVNALKGLEVEELQTLHNKVSGQTFSLNTSFRQSQKPTDDYSDSFQNTGSK